MSTDDHVGEPPLGTDLGRVLVVSPHLDDAVFSCGHLLAVAREAHVVTVFAGTPERYPEPMATWDAMCGFAPGDDVVARRRAENARALALLSATGTDLDLLDQEYRAGSTSPSAVAALIARVVDAWRPTTVAFPLGLRHRDHVVVSEAVLRITRRRREWTALAYAEFPYAWWFADAVGRRMTSLRHRGARLTPVLGVPPDERAKEQALCCYESQLTGAGLVPHVTAIARAPEMLWLLSRRAPLPVRAARRGRYVADASWRSGPRNRATRTGARV